MNPRRAVNLNSSPAVFQICQEGIRWSGVYATAGHANFVYLPGTERPWREVFGGAGINARYYPDGAARITVGGRVSTQIILAAAAKSIS